MAKAKQPKLGKPAEALLEVHLAEYKALYSEVNQQLKLQETIITASLAIVGGFGAILGITRFDALKSFPELTVVASLMLSTLTATSIYASTQMVDIGNYITGTLRKKINALLPAASRTNDLLNWATVYATITPRAILKGTLSVGKYAVSFLPSAIFEIMYYQREIASPAQPETFQKALFWLALIFILLPFIGSGVNYFAFQKRVNSL